MKRWLALLTGLLLLGTGGSLWGLYALVEKGAAAKPFWETTLSRLLHTQVRITSLASQRQGIWPALQANGVDLGPKGYVQHVSFRVNPLHMLRVWALLPDRLQADGLRLHIVPEGAPGQLMEAIGQIGQIEIRNAAVVYQTPRQTLPLQDVHLTLETAARGRQRLLVSGHLGGLSFEGHGLGHLHPMDGTLHLELTGGALPPGLVFLGFGTMGITLQARSGQLLEAGGLIEAENLILPLGERGVPFERIAGGFQWQQRDGPSPVGHLVLRDVDVRMHGEALTMKRFEVAGNPMDGGELFMEAQSIPMRILAQAAQAFPGQGGEALAALGERGVVRDVRASFPTHGAVTLQATADGITLHSPWGRMEETHGQVSLQGAQLRATLDQGRMVVTSPMLFAHPMRFAAHGIAEMEFAGARLAALRLIDTHAENTDLAADLDLQLQLPREGSPLIQTRLHLQRANVSAMADYLPPAWVGKEVRTWLKEALQAGRIDQGLLELTGPLQGFPFREGSQDPGLFVASLHVHDATFDYAPPWPAITGMQGNITFAGPTLAVVIQQGRIAGTTIRRVVATMDDLRRLHLKVDADLQGSMSAYLRFLQTAPFSQEKDMDWLDALWGKGQASAHLQLGLPLHHDRKQHIVVDATMHDATVGYGKSPLHVSALKGTLRYEDGFFLSSGLRGRWGGAPLHATLRRFGQQSKIIATGSLRGDHGPTLLGLPPILAGETPWNLQLAFGHGTIEGTLDSDLQGLALALPPPLGKRAQESRRLRLDLQQHSTQPQVAVSARYGEQGQARLLFDAHGRVQKGTIGVGLPPAAMPSDGLALQMRLARLAVADISSLEGTASMGQALPWRSVRLDVDQLDLGAGHRGALLVRAERHAAGDWRGTVAGRLARGLLRRQDQAWRFQLDHLLLPQDPAAWSLLTSSNGAPHDASRPWPHLEMAVDRLLFGEYPLGRLQVHSSPLADGGAAKVTLQPPGGSLVLEARCTAGQHPPCNAAMRLQAMQEQAFWQTFRPWNSGFRAKKATVRFAGEYPPSSDSPGAPLGIPDGTLHLALYDGVIERIKPGLGRLFGVFGLQALPRRLKLDFSDLYEPGLAFNSIQGSFAIRQGVATTEGVTLLGPMGRMVSKGWVDLEHGRLDQHLVVTPEVGSELAVGGLIAGGPVVGGAMLLAGTLLHKPLGALTTLRYHVHGAWDAPVIAKENKENKEKGKPAGGG